MARSAKWLRLVALVWAVAQTALTPALVLGDAIADRAAVSGVAGGAGHVEESPGKGCRPAHSADCAICRFLTNHASRVSTLPALPAVIARVERPVTGVRTAGSVTLPHNQSRAPPSLS